MFITLVFPKTNHLSVLNELRNIPNLVIETLSVLTLNSKGVFKSVIPNHKPGEGLKETCAMLTYELLKKTIIKKKHPTRNIIFRFIGFFTFLHNPVQKKHQ